MKKHKKLWLLILVTALISSTVWFIQCEGQAAAKSFKLEKITKGDVASAISCSGTLEAVGTVEVGTQVSGVLDHLYADFNDHVKKGQVLAQLDTIMLKAQVIEAEANYQKSEAQLEKAQADYQRNLPLFNKNFISEAEFLPYKIDLKTQEAVVKSAKAAVVRADRNLKYAVIHSPIDGTIIQRSVEEGQTVAASLQAPTLFIIAEDLSKMEIHAMVDESDIGQIREGQRAAFEVQAYPDNEFSGVVSQVRLQPEVVQNVVNYTVVIEAKNDENLLLPGMTATVDFYVQEKQDVLLVPNTALHFTPTDEMMAKIHEKHKSEMPKIPEGGLPPKMPPQAMGNNSDADNFAMIWYKNDDGSIDMEPIITGVTDGKKTEIVRSRNLEEGITVIAGWIGGQSNDEDEGQSQRRGGGMGPPPMF